MKRKKNGDAEILPTTSGEEVQNRLRIIKLKCGVTKKII